MTTDTPMTTNATTTGGAPDGAPVTRCVMASPIGPLTLSATPDAIVSIEFGERPGVASCETSRTTGPEAGRGHAVLDAAITQLEEYFGGGRTEFDLPLAPSGTEFQIEAWAVLREIPYGETITYGEQAARLGDRNKSRAVGAANGRNPIPIVVPCHRVVGSNGHLTGFAGGIDTKAWLLDHEFEVRAAGGG
jgi:methylated-DNA-[protein]-cysteine S-methyltransferase